MVDAKESFIKDNRAITPAIRLYKPKSSTPSSTNIKREVYNNIPADNMLLTYCTPVFTKTLVEALSILTFLF